MLVIKLGVFNIKVIIKAMGVYEITQSREDNRQREILGIHLHLGRGNYKLLKVIKS